MSANEYAEVKVTKLIEKDFSAPPKLDKSGGEEKWLTKFQKFDQTATAPFEWADGRGNGKWGYLFTIPSKSTYRHGGVIDTRDNRLKEAFVECGVLPGGIQMGNNRSEFLSCCSEIYRTFFGTRPIGTPQIVVFETDNGGRIRWLPKFNEIAMKTAPWLRFAMNTENTGLILPKARKKRI